MRGQTYLPHQINSTNELIMSEIPPHQAAVLPACTPYNQFSKRDLLIFSYEDYVEQFKQ